LCFDGHLYFFIVISNTSGCLALRQYIKLYLHANANVARINLRLCMQH